MSRFLFLLVFLFACHDVAKPLAIGEDGTPLPRQCELPVEVSFVPNVPEALRKQALAGFQYWNEVTGEELFMSGPDLAEDVPALSIRGAVEVALAVPEMLDPEVLGITYMFPAPDGCLMATRVEYNPSWFARLSYDGRTSVIRHEAGHVLGIMHTPRHGDLMYWAHDGSADPLGIGPYENAELVARYDLEKIRSF